jgi:chemotaxis protein histidine kinase CheA
MSSSSGLLDFFILEASDYVEQLDGAVASGGASGPGHEAFLRAARSLRGTATMARVGGIAEIASALERIGRGLRDGAAKWDPALAGAVVAAVDDLKILIRAVRTWGATEDQRARERVADLVRHAPIAQPPHPTPTTSGAGGTGFLAAETSQIAIALDAFVARPSGRDALSVALERARALRGVAAIRDLPPLPDIVEAIETAAKPFELGTGEATGPQLSVLAAAVRALRAVSREIAATGKPDPDSADALAFAAAAAALEEIPTEAEQIVPIADLFFNDEGPHVVSTAPNPPTTPAQRFRMEVVSHAEHLARLIGDAKRNLTSQQGQKSGRALSSALRTLESSAAGFGERAVAAFVAGVRHATTSLDKTALGAVEEVAKLLSNPGTRPETLAERLSALSAPSGLDAAIAAGLQNGEFPSSIKPSYPSLMKTLGLGEESYDRGETQAAPSGAAASAPRPAAATAPVPQQAPPPAPAGSGYQLRSPTPTGQELHSLLGEGISGISRLEEHPLSAPVALPDEMVVPIETLLYSGRDALVRAREIRDSIRRDGGTPAPETLEELFALLDLATS